MPLKKFDSIDTQKENENIINKNVENTAVQNIEEEINLIREKGFDVTMPYTSSGVQLGQGGKNIFGGATFYSTQIGDGETEWRNTRVFFVKNGLRIKRTEQFIYYKQIDYIDYSEKSDRKGLFAFKRNTISFIMKNGEEIIMRVMPKELNAIKYCIEEDMQNIKEAEPANNTNNDDILIKYFEMFEQDLITREEFILKKEELQNDKNNDDPILESEPLKPLYCGNCGSLIEEGSKFCTNCGNKLTYLK